MRPPDHFYFASFLDNLHEQLNEHLADETLDVYKLTRLVGMSRTDLHRKLRRATGMSTTAYVRYIRLNRAAQLLLSRPEWSILSIALEVGFRNGSYFSNRFKEMFGMSPIQWRAAHGGTKRGTHCVW